MASSFPLPVCFFFWNTTDWTRFCVVLGARVMGRRRKKRGRKECCSVALMVVIWGGHSSESQDPHLQNGNAKSLTNLLKDG